MSEQHYSECYTDYDGSCLWHAVEHDHHIRHRHATVKQSLADHLRLAHPPSTAPKASSNIECPAEAEVESLRQRLQRYDRIVTRLAGNCSKDWDKWRAAYNELFSAAVDGAK